MSRLLALVLVAGAVWCGGQATALATTAPMADETLLLALANQGRAAARLAPVASDANLVALARAHAGDMAAQSRLFHTPNLPAAAPAWDPVGEVVARSDLSVVNWVGVVANDFLTSPVHRAVVLSPRYTSIGVGVAYNGTKTYVVEEFGRPRGAAPPPPPPAAPTVILRRPPARPPAPAAARPPAPPKSPPTTPVAPTTTTTLAGVVVAVSPPPILTRVASVHTTPPASPPDWTLRMAVVVLLATVVAHGLHRRLVHA